MQKNATREPNRIRCSTGRKPSRIPQAVRQHKETTALRRIKSTPIQYEKTWTINIKCLQSVPDTIYILAQISLLLRCSLQFACRQKHFALKCPPREGNEMSSLKGWSTQQIQPCWWVTGQTRVWVWHTTAKTSPKIKVLKKGYVNKPVKKCFGLIFLVRRPDP